MSDAPLLTWKGRRVRSTGEGPEAAARKVPVGTLRPGSLLFVPSPLEGWGLDHLLDSLPDHCVVVVFEKDRDLWAHCEASFWSTLGSRRSDRRLFVLDSDTERSVVEVFGRLPLGRLKRCEFLTFSGSWLSDRVRYRQVFLRFEQGLVRWWANRMTAIHMGPLWIRNLIDNVSRIDFEALPWPDWGRQTVLVCGAGVSLEKALPWAKTHRSSIKILAADTALPVLRDYGLVPDGVVCLEAQHANLRDFSGWMGSSVQLFSDIVTYPPGNRVFALPPLWFATELTPLSLWNRWPWPTIPRLPPLGSVGVAAAWIAWKLTGSSVILAGLDFSFPLGRTHARGAPSLTETLRTNTRFRGVEQPGSWIRPGVVAHKASWATTTVLKSYSEVLADHARKEAHRTWVWDDEGLPLGLPLWVTSEVTPPTRSSQASSSVPVDLTSPAGRLWLMEESSTWRAILDDFAVVNGQPTDQDWERLRGRLEDVDYLTFFFPDPEYRQESDWLIRAQAQVRWALSRLNKRTAATVLDD